MSPKEYQSDTDGSGQTIYSAFSSPGVRSRNPSISASSPGLSSWTFSSASSVSSNCSSPPAFGSTVPNTPTIPKIEELDEDTVIKAPLLPIEQTLRRGRGRPRKHPLPVQGETGKVAKGRSKTGCMTCRRRKKKCDETKPECNNCVKNSVVCEGYPEKVRWQSGKQKALALQYSATKEILSRALSPNQVSDLPCLIDGIESQQDRMLLDHFVYHVSRVLTLMNDDTNPFREMLLPLALQHRGLMHSILCLSGSHLDQSDPAYVVARHHHFIQACQHLRTDAAITGESSVTDPVVAQMLIFCLTSICLGETQGEYRPHMDAARALLDKIETNTPFGKFLFEFFMFHDVINGVTTLDRRPPVRYMDDYRLPGFIMQPETGALLGVLDGLFAYISKITVLRDAIRERKRRRIHPCVDYEMLSTAVAVDSEIRAWVAPQYSDPQRFVAAQLYRQSTWVYLYRTIQPSQPGAKIRHAVNEGLQYMRRLPPDSGTQSVLLMPLFILGCAAFELDQRPEIVERFDSLYEYSGLKNILAASTAVRKVWAYMDAGDDASWDWEAIIKNMGYDFLAT